MTEDNTAKKHIKKILSIWGTADRICKEKTQRVDELKKFCIEVDTIQNVNDNDEKNYKFSNSHHIENSVISTIDVYEKTIFCLKEDIQQILSIKAMVDSWVSFLETEEKNIITLRYKDGLSWDCIPKIINKSRMQCFRIHNNAIKKWSTEKDILQLHNNC